MKRIGLELLMSDRERQLLNPKLTLQGNQFLMMEELAGIQVYQFLFLLFPVLIQ